MTASASAPPSLLWLRRDLRLSDHPGWQAARAGGGPVIPVFILDPLAEAQLGPASLWRLGESLRDHAAVLEAHGSRLILRRGEALTVLRALIAETGARRVVWSRLYDSRATARDGAIKAALKAEGIAATSVNASLLFEPWTVATGAGGFYRVFTPFWKAVRGREVPEPLPAPAGLAAPAAWPASEDLAGWWLGGAMNRGAAIVAGHAATGEEAARRRLAAFAAGPIARYAEDRDRPDIDGTSRLSAHLACGELSPRQAWHAGRAALERAGGGGPETFLKELVWREFAYHLLHHTPRIETAHWRGDWDGFPWRPDNEDAERWRRGMTGVPMVDAAMREMYVTGTMHNRCRMIAASYLAKHLLTDWRVGAEWFRYCLIDWDPASNALGWQWTAGSGPDAAPFFRIFNPETQAERFDPGRRYRDRFIAEGHAAPHPDALAFFEAAPRSWRLRSDDPYSAPVIGLADGRRRALDAFEWHRRRAR